MSSGIYGKPFINIEKYIDMEAFDKLHPDICRDLVLAKDSASLGYLDLHEPNKPFINLGIYNPNLKPVWYFYDQFKILPDDHPLRVTSSQFKNENDYILYITYAYGAHNPYKIYQIIDHTVNFEHPQFFSTIEWIKGLPIFSYVKSAYFLIVEGGGTSMEHSDPEHEGDNELHDFIYLRHDLNRPFYIRNVKTQEKLYFNTRAACFNDHDYHGSDPCPQTTYMLRVDGKFTEEFRQTLIDENV